jgi:hypothetical protein
VTAPKSDLRKYIDTTQALPADCVLGNILWYGVEDKPYDVDHVKQSFDLLNLNPSVLPPDNKSINAFEKASQEIHGRKYPLPGDLEAELLIHEVSRDEETVLRQVTRKVRDAKQKELGYDKVGELVFYRDVTRGGKVQKGTSRLRTSLVPFGPGSATIEAGERVELLKALEEVETCFPLYRDTWDGNKVRGILRDYVGYLNGVMMRSGVYFVHSTRTTELEALQKFARGLDGGSMTLFPLPELKAMREEVIEAFQAEAAKELGEVVAAIQKVRGTRKTLTPEMHRKLKEQYNTVMRKATEYGRTLRVTQERTAGAAELASDALLSLEADLRKQMES